ncbi:carbohydrate-binding protein [Echinicola pacifica]|uniref:Carbohydrate-binding protein n=1 Tax=Echinicola pacifica TaxID=346377 RepID=A0A918PN74_9BACT|nr:RagB/SusD family nutrient uptake outer membrane protein [Echinicola pacifica]GGZ16601.1 carbohydrate-binding protein [Echinicola pacifica]
MKLFNIYTKALLVISLLGTSSCLSEINEEPVNKLTVDRLLNKSTIVNFRDRSYDKLNSTFQSYHNGEILDAYTDDAFRAGTGTPFDWNSGLLSPDRNMFSSTLWDSYWEGIRKSNLAMEYLPQSQVPEDLITRQNIEMWVDEAKLLRAWYHFMLIKNFGPIPFTDQAYSPDFTGWADLVRPSYQEITDRIVLEIDEVIAAGRIPLRQAANNEFDKVNMAVAYALKSRVLLFNASPLNNPNGDSQKWQRAADATREAIDKVAGTYSLLPMADYDKLFSQDATVLNSEIIMRSAINGAPEMNAQNGVDLASYGSATQSNNAGVVPSQELVDSFELTNGSLPVQSYTNESHTAVELAPNYSEATGADPYEDRDARFYHAIVYNGAIYGRFKGMAAAVPDIQIFTFQGFPGSGFNETPTSDTEVDKRRSTTGYYAKKFRSANYWGSTTGGVDANKIFFRLAELYLNLAEAECALGNLGAAAEALNIVRERAGQPQIQSVLGYSNDQNWLMNRVRNERRVELCFEDHRFYDQRRWDILETNGALTGMKITSSDGTAEGEFSYERVKIDVPRSATSDHYLILPLATEEVRRLPGIGQPSVWQ